MSQITYTTDRSNSRKHTYITIQKDGSVLVKTDLLTSSKQIETFIRQKEAWILRKQNAILRAREQTQNHFYLFGELYEREHRIQEDIDRLYREKAKEIIPPLVKRYSEEMDLYPNRISFRKNRSRWGSCSSRNNLTFNTMLIQTPPPFIEYVVVHELAHIRHKNHSRAFWSLVHDILPDYKQREKQIKERYFL